MTKNQSLARRRRNKFLPYLLGCSTRTGAKAAAEVKRAKRRKDRMVDDLFFFRQRRGNGGAVVVVGCEWFCVVSSWGLDES